MPTFDTFDFEIFIFEKLKHNLSIWQNLTDSEKVQRYLSYKKISIDDDLIFNKAIQCVKNTESKWRNDFEKRIQELIKSAKIPTRFRNKLAKDFIVTESNQNVVECLKAVRNNQGFYIYGECGTGKTLLASIIQNERAHQLKSSAFICATDIFSELNPFNSNAETVINKLNLLKSTPCLIIDDLGVEKPTDRVKQNLFDIINYRYNEELQTIITSNFSLEELAIRISGTNRAEGKRQKIADYEGDRIIRRIKAICSIIELQHY